MINKKEKTPMEFNNKMVACTEFESVNAALRGQCVKPLHQQAI